MKRLMIMAAGTGGHIFPGLAVAQTMRERGWQVTWLGTTGGMEQQLVPLHAIELDALDFTGMRGKGWRHTLNGAFKLVLGFGACLRFLARRKPDVVLGMGGYVTVPGGLMARLRGIPLVLVNADAALLLSNRALAPLAQHICFGFPSGADISNAGNHAKQTKQSKQSKHASVTGNPVRQEILALPEPAARFAARHGPLRILVVGGSLGAKALNDALPAALALLDVSARPLVTHQSGKKNGAALRAQYASAGVAATVVDFIDDMAAAYGMADLVLCRAGAITLAELTAAGVASVLVPLVASTTSHQRSNAQWLAAHKAALHVPQTELTPARLALVLATPRQQCLEMAVAARAVGRREASAAIASVLEQLAAGTRQNIKKQGSIT